MVTAPEIPDWLRTMYPFAPRSFRTPRGARMSYLDEGPRGDEAVLLLHGNPTWSFYFRSLVRALAPEWRCIAPDHIGMGLSEKPARYDYTLSGRVGDIEALVESLGLRRVHLVVHDWGGAIGFGYATRHPERMGRLVITNTAAFPSPHLPRRIALCRAPALGALLVRGCNGFAWPATRMAMHARALSAGERRGYLFPYDSWASRVAVHAFVRDIPMGPAHPSWNTLQAIAQGLPQLRDRPALVVWGRRDFCFHDWYLGRWQELFPQAGVAADADAGHYVLEDAPGAVGRITGFLRNP